MRARASSTLVRKGFDTPHSHVVLLRVCPARAIYSSLQLFLFCLDGAGLEGDAAALAEGARTVKADGIVFDVFL